MQFCFFIHSHFSPFPTVFASKALSRMYEELCKDALAKNVLGFSCGLRATRYDIELQAPAVVIGLFPLAMRCG
jgi:hypothetical protein